MTHDFTPNPRGACASSERLHEGLLSLQEITPFPAFGAPTVEFSPALDRCHASEAALEGVDL